MTNDKRERRRGMLTMFIIIIALCLTCCDVRIGDVTVWRSPLGQIADALRDRRLKGGE